MQSQQQSHQPLQQVQNSALEETLADITEITRPQAEAMRDAAEESHRSQEEKGPAGTKFPRFGNKPSENFTA
eukprot:4185648-Ditylum_brightwellii.AAC.1